MYKKMFHAMLDKHDAMMLLLDPDTGQIIDANQAANRFYGYTPPELNCMNINDLSSPLMLDLAKLRAGQTHFILPHQLASGEIRTVEIYISAVTWQEQPMFFAIIHNITERTRAEEALRESEQKLKILLELLPIGISVLNTDNQIVYMNPALEQTLQISHEGLLRGDYRQRSYIHPDGTPMQATDFASSQAIQQQQPVYNVETGIITENNQTVWVNVSAVPVALSDWRVIIVSDDITQRKQMKAALREKEEQHFIHELFEAIPTPIFYKDVQGRYLGCNQTFASLNKKLVAEVVSKTAFEITTSEYAHKYNEMDLALLAHPDVPQVYEYSIYHKISQKERTFLTTKSVIKNVHNQITGIVGVMIDITERKQMEDTFRESEQKFRMVIESVSEAIVMINEEGSIMLANNKVSQMFGYTRQELLGQDIELLLPERYRQKHLKHLAHYFSQPQTRAMGKGRELVGQHKNGHEFQLEIGLSYAELNGNLSAIAFITDITERKQVAAALQERLEFFQLMFENHNAIMFLLEPTSGQIIESNQAARQFYGYDVVEMNSLKIQDINMLSPAESEVARQQAIQNKVNFFIFPHKLASGEIRTVEVHSSPIIWKNTQALFSIIHDITEREQARRDLQASEARYRALEGELRQLNTQKDRFLAIIAHDLRNPFSVILGLSDYLTESWAYLEKDDLKMAVEAIQSATRNLYKLLQNLLSWAENQQNKLAFEPMPLSIAELGWEIMEVLELNAHPKEIILRNLAQPEHLTYADYNMISTVIRNLLSNAIKFTPNGGQISLATEAQADFIKVSITDTGVGIPLEYQAKLFQLDNTFKTYGTGGEAGTGLGLLLCQQLVHKNGGEIGITSIEGQGSTFYFTLPKISHIQPL